MEVALGGGLYVQGWMLLLDGCTDNLLLCKCINILFCAYLCVCVLARWRMYACCCLVVCLVNFVLITVSSSATSPCSNWIVVRLVDPQLPKTLVKLLQVRFWEEGSFLPQSSLIESHTCKKSSFVAGKYFVVLFRYLDC